ncbi:hypothetical protein KUCAC02_021642 [Chaenocephalus aceratus]|uniref:Uncharacterized protein n=1 Tax=Chaenocephalus aceratus TaxID=36190 RepID=A0ACB9XI33_CHAAC|nr:hypothetical protein KUCAC02_021642 [Chaenocephalus aceratus]
MPELRKSKAKPNGKKPPAEEKKQYLELEYTKIRVVDFDLKELVVLPREIDLNEWLASTVSYPVVSATTFFNLINLQYSTISEFCTGETCQAMTACNTIYYWYDERGKKTKCTAPQYVDFVMSLCQKLVTDEEIFPTKYGDLYHGRPVRNPLRPRPATRAHPSTFSPRLAPSPSSQNHVTER